MKKWWIVILVVGAILRLYRLDWAPPHLSNDEISIAYDAYSVARTGRDEHNQFLPISFQSHSTYKAPLYAYLLAPLTLILPNSEVTARLPSAALGTVTILVFGLLVIRLTGKKQLGLVAAGLLALTPWHIYTSRMALESNVALFFLATGLWLWLSDKKYWSMFFLALSIYGYHTEWLLTPLLLLGLIGQDKKSWKTAGLLVLLCLPIGVNFLGNLGTNARANTEMVWREAALGARLSDPKTPFWAKPVLITKNILSNYAGYLNFDYLFFNGLETVPHGHPFQTSLLLAVWLPAGIWGLFEVKKWVKPEWRRWIWFWLLVSPLVPAMTQGGNNQVRNLPAVLPYTLIISLGVYEFWRAAKRWMKVVAIAGVAINFWYFGAVYFNHFPIEAGKNFQYGYKQVAQAIAPILGKYQRVVVETRFGDKLQYVGVPHLYLAYFGNVDPRALQQRENNDGLHFDKYTIKEINWNQEKITPQTIYVVPVANLPPEKLGLKLYSGIVQTNGLEEFRVYLTN